MPDIDTLVTQFVGLFPSVPDRVAFIHNASEIESSSSSGKVEIDFDRKPRSPSRSDFLTHLGVGEPGGPSISLTPIVPNPASLSELTHCSWAVLDFDLYKEFESGSLSKTGITGVAQERAKFVPLNSKSGGLHLWLFFSVPQLAADVRAFLAYVKNNLGLPPEVLDRVEVFPKQDKLEAKDSGSAMSLPYFEALVPGKTTICKRHAFDKRGLGLNLESFLKLVAESKTVLPELKTKDPVQESSAKEKKQTPLGLSRSQYDDEVVALLKGPYGVYAGPPCFLTLMASGKKIDAGRNNRAYDLGVYLRKAWGSGDDDRESAIARGVKIIQRTFDLEHPDRFTMSEARAALASGYDGDKSFKCDEIRGLTRDGLLVCDKKVTSACMKCRHGLGSTRFAELHDLVPAFRRMQDNQTTRVNFRVKMVGQGDEVSEEVSMPLADFADYRRVKTAVANKTGYLFSPPVGDDGRVKRFDEIWEQFAVELNVQCKDVHQLPDRSYGSLVKPVIQRMLDGHRRMIRRLPDRYDSNICIVDEGGGDARKQAVLFTHETLVAHVMIAGGRAEEVRKVDDLMTAIDQLCERTRKTIEYPDGESVEYYVCLLAKNDLFIRNRSQTEAAKTTTAEPESYFDKAMKKAMEGEITPAEEREFVELLPKREYDDIGPMTYEGPDEAYPDPL